MLLLLLFNQSKKKVTPEGATVVVPLGFWSLLRSMPRDIVEGHPSHRNVRHLRLGASQRVRKVLRNLILRVAVNVGQGRLDLFLQFVEFVGQYRPRLVQGFFLTSYYTHSVVL